jgi:hypothetical protein
MDRTQRWPVDACQADGAEGGQDAGAQQRPVALPGLVFDSGLGVEPCGGVPGELDLSGIGIDPLPDVGLGQLVGQPSLGVDFAVEGAAVPAPVGTLVPGPVPPGVAAIDGSS